LIKDDGGNAQGAQQGAQQAVDEGAEIILGPLFAQSVPGAAQVARNRGIPVIAFSTDSSVAGRGVYLLSFLPESDVTRIVDYAAGTGKRSFAAYLPENAYGNVVEVAFKQAVARKGGRLVAFEKYGADRAQGSAAIVQARERGSCYWRMTVTRLRLSRISSFRAAPISSACNCSARVCGTIRVFGNANLRGGLYAAPDPSGFRSFLRAIAPNTAAIRSAPRRWPMMVLRWLRRWRARRVVSVSRRRFSPIRRALRASMACSVFAATAPTNAASP
jgi:hypothetical protein